ncbi:MAG: hypothetical protein ACR2HE_03890 [Casimicrobiaceae bacterium]
MESVVLENVKASELPAAWRKRAKVKANEVLTVTIAIAKRAQTPAPRSAKKPNASFGMWHDRTDLDPAAFVRALRKPRSARR